MNRDEPPEESPWVSVETSPDSVPATNQTSNPNLIPDVPAKTVPALPHPDPGPVPAPAVSLGAVVLGVGIAIILGSCIAIVLYIQFPFFGAASTTTTASSSSKETPPATTSLTATTTAPQTPATKTDSHTATAIAPKTPATKKETSSDKSTKKEPDTGKSKPPDPEPISMPHLKEPLPGLSTDRLYPNVLRNIDK